MLPSTRLTFDEIILILRARAWLLLIIVALVATAAAAIALWLPNRYRSETLILVVPQRIPEAYVKSTVTARLEDRLQSITQQILSRTRLERIITDFNLYAADRRAGVVMEAIVDEMRKDIDVKVVKGNAFRVTYAGSEAKTVMEVTNRLASLFVEENLHDREVLAEDTNQFLGAQVADSRRRLIDQEKALETYRRQYSGELPSQLSSNVQALQNVQVQLQSLVESTNRDRDRRLLLERQLRDAVREIPAAPKSPEQRLSAAYMELEVMEARLQPDHPDLKRMQRVVRELEMKAMGAAGPPQDTEHQARIEELRLEIEQIDRQLAFKSAEDHQLRATASDYQRRIDRVPARESELAELTRDYSTLQTMYQTLLAKQEESKIAADLERRQIGDRFKLLDPARIAEKPFSPKRWVIDLAGICFGMSLGLTLIVILEARDRTFKTDNDLTQELALPVLAVVPFMASPQEQRLAARRRVALAIATGSIVAACIPVVIYSLLH
jgi:polysaccharide chain length determinant protein (PEP-CTERM system associated)